MKKILSLFAAVLLAGSMWGTEVVLGNWTTKPVSGSNTTSLTGTLTDNKSNSWSYSLTGSDRSKNPSQSVYSNSTYWQIGANGNMTTAVFSTSAISGTITNIEVECSAYKGLGEVNVTIGGSAFGTQNQTMPTWNGDSKYTGNRGGSLYFTGSASGEIVVTMNPTTGGRAIYLSFIKVTIAEEINLGAAGLATFSADYIFTVTGATAYKAAVSGTDINLTALEGAIPANTAVILKGEADATANIGTAATATADVTGNELQSTASATHTVLGSEHIYCLTKGTNEFNQVAEGVVIPKNKAYFSLSGVPAAPLRIAMPEEVATGVENVAAVKATKALVNGQLVIVKNGQMFNLNGMLVK